MQTGDIDADDGGDDDSCTQTIDYEKMVEDIHHFRR